MTAHFGSFTTETLKNPPGRADLHEGHLEGQHQLCPCFYSDLRLHCHPQERTVVSLPSQERHESGVIQKVLRSESCGCSLGRNYSRVRIRKGPVCRDYRRGSRYGGY